MNDPDPNNPNNSNDLIIKALRGELTGPEQRRFQECLEADESLRQTYAEEESLQHLLDRLPNVPVPTNFTSLAVRAARVDAQDRVRPATGWFRFRFARVAAGLATVLAAGLLALHQYRKAERNEMAQSVSAFSEVASVIASDQGSPAVLFEDFEAIQQLALPSEAELDLELLVALQK